MQLQNLGLLLIYMGFPTACLIWAWRCSVRRIGQSMRPTLRENLQVASLLLATLSMLLICAFVYSNYNPNGASFMSPAPRGWIISNRLALATWLLASLTLAVGKGKLWLPVLLWTISAPLCASFYHFYGLHLLAGAMDAAQAFFGSDPGLQLQWLPRLQHLA